MSNNTNKENNGKQVIIDLVNRLKYEVSQQTLAELAGYATPLSQAEFVDWRAKIDEESFESADCPWFKGEWAGQLREFMHRIADMTRDIGGKAVPIGKRILRWIFSVAERYPRTLRAAVILAAISFIVGCIPLIGKFLLPLVEVVAMGIVGLVFLGEWSEHSRISDGGNA